MVDQRKLPSAEVTVRCKTVNEVAKAIRTMVIRGAPAIGVAAAMGVALAPRAAGATGTRQFAAEFQKTPGDLPAATRPTASILFWAIERMKRRSPTGALAGESVEQLAALRPRRGSQIHDEDVASCRAIGAFGGGACPDGARALTYRNAGAWRPRDTARALGVVRGAVEAGEARSPCSPTRHARSCEGARLTAWSW